MDRLNNYNNDMEYMQIISDIMENKKFKKLAEYKHHGISRLEHSIRVSYNSYKIAKKLKLNYYSTARAGLLHDFFLNEDLSNRKQKLSMFFHPYKSIDNSNQYFNLNAMEQDIIISHMFPTLPHKIPKYLESWLVSIIDKVVATKEFYTSYAKPYTYKLSNIYFMLLFFKK